MSHIRFNCPNGAVHCNPCTVDLVVSFFLSWSSYQRLWQHMFRGDGRRTQLRTQPTYTSFHVALPTQYAQQVPRTTSKVGNVAVLSSPITQCSARMPVEVLCLSSLPSAIYSAVVSFFVIGIVVQHLISTSSPTLSYVFALCHPASHLRNRNRNRNRNHTRKVNRSTSTAVIDHRAMCASERLERFLPSRHANRYYSFLYEPLSLL
jgi:hypothetical protein